MKGSHNKFTISVIVLIGVVAASFSFVKFVLIPMLEDEKNTYEINNQQISEAEKKINSRKKLEDELRKREDSIKKIEEALLASQDKLDFIESLENIAESTGNKYKITNPREIFNENTEKLEQISVSMELEGQFVNIMSFMRDVDALPYLVNVSRLSVNKSKGDSDELTANLELEVFVN